MNTYHTLVVKTDGKWSPQFGSHDLGEVEDEKMTWDDILYDVAIVCPHGEASYDPNDIKILHSSGRHYHHIDIEVMKLNEVKTVEVEYLMESSPWLDATQQLTLEEYIDEMEKLNAGEYPCDAWIEVVSTSS